MSTYNHLPVLPVVFSFINQKRGIVVQARKRRGTIEKGAVTDAEYGFHDSSWNYLGIDNQFYQFPSSRTSGKRKRSRAASAASRKRKRQRQ
jgi:hypothetical protein